MGKAAILVLVLGIIFSFSASPVEGRWAVSPVTAGAGYENMDFYLSHIEDSRVGTTLKGGQTDLQLLPGCQRACDAKNEVWSKTWRNAQALCYRDCADNKYRYIVEIVGLVECEYAVIIAKEEMKKESYDDEYLEKLLAYTGDVWSMRTAKFMNDKLYPDYDIPDEFYLRGEYTRLFEPIQENYNDIDRRWEICRNTSNELIEIVRKEREAKWKREQEERYEGRRDLSKEEELKDALISKGKQVALGDVKKEVKLEELPKGLADDIRAHEIMSKEMENLLIEYEEKVKAGTDLEEVLKYEEKAIMTELTWFTIEANRLFRKVDEHFGLDTSKHNPFSLLKQLELGKEEMSHEEIGKRIVYADAAYRDLIMDENSLKSLTKQGDKKKIDELQQTIRDKKSELKSEYGRILLFDPHNIEAGLSLGKIYREEGNNKAAHVFYKKALIDTHQTNPELFNEIKTLLGTGELRNKVMMDVGLETLPKDTPFWQQSRKELKETKKEDAPQEVESWSLSASLSNKIKEVFEGTVNAAVFGI